MIKKISLIFLAFLTFTLSSCGDESIESTTINMDKKVAEAFDEDFRIMLFSEKDAYNENEEVNYYSLPLFRLSFLTLPSVKTMSLLFLILILPSLAIFLFHIIGPSTDAQNT